MSFNTEKRFMDVGFFNIDRTPTPPEKKTNLLIIIVITATITMTIAAIAYCAGWRAGIFAAPCCLPLDLDLNFDFEG